MSTSDHADHLIRFVLDTDGRQVIGSRIDAVAGLTHLLADVSYRDSGPPGVRRPKLSTSVGQDVLLHYGKSGSSKGYSSRDETLVLPLRHGVFLEGIRASTTAASSAARKCDLAAGSASNVIDSSGDLGPTDSSGSFRWIAAGRKSGVSARFRRWRTGEGMGACRWWALGRAPLRVGATNSDSDSTCIGEDTAGPRRCRVASSSQQLDRPDDEGVRRNVESADGPMPTSCAICLSMDSTRRPRDSPPRHTRSGCGRGTMSRRAPKERTGTARLGRRSRFSARSRGL